MTRRGEALRVYRRSLRDRREGHDPAPRPERLAAITAGSAYPSSSSLPMTRRTGRRSRASGDRASRRALQILREVKDTVGVPVLTDVHSPEEAAAARQKWSMCSRCPRSFPGRRTCSSRAGGRARPVNIKKGQFLSPDDMSLRDRQGGIDGQHADISSPSGGHASATITWSMISGPFPSCGSSAIPVIFDATHSVQIPGGAGGASGGRAAVHLPPGEGGHRGRG